MRLLSTSDSRIHTEGAAVFIVWTRDGWLVHPVVILGGLLGSVIAEMTQNWLLVPMLGIMGTALAVLALGLRLNRKQIVGRDQRGNTVTAVAGHTLYWIPVEYWSAIVLVVGTGFLLFAP